MTLRPLDQLPVAVDPSHVEQAMEPFRLPDDDRRWRKALARRWRRTLLRLAGKLIGRARRDRAAIENEYREAWAVGYQRYSTSRTSLRETPWTWRDRRLLLDPAAATRIRSLYLAAVLEELRPARVLEVGCGNGINLLSLAAAFPQIKFTGVDLTEEGVRQAHSAKANPAVQQILLDYSPLEARDASALGRIDFRQGDAAALPFEDNAFDLVMTVLAVEQMESIRHRALAEIARVSSAHVLMLEPFRDSNAKGMKRLYVRSRDYFQGSIADLNRYGLEVLWATEDFPQEAFLGAALVLSRKTGSQAR